MNKSEINFKKPRVAVVQYPARNLIGIHNALGACSTQKVRVTLWAVSAMYRTSCRVINRVQDKSIFLHSIRKCPRLFEPASRPSVPLADWSLYADAS